MSQEINTPSKLFQIRVREPIAINKLEPSTTKTPNHPSTFSLTEIALFANNMDESHIQRRDFNHSYATYFYDNEDNFLYSSSTPEDIEEIGPDVSYLITNAEPPHLDEIPKHYQPIWNPQIYYRQETNNHPNSSSWRLQSLKKDYRHETITEANQHSKTTLPKRM